MHNFLDGMLGVAELTGLADEPQFDRKQTHWMTDGTGGRMVTGFIA